MFVIIMFLFKQKTAYEMRISDLSSDVCSSDLQRAHNGGKAEYRGRNIAATAFVADTPYRFRRDEIQGNGLTGPYQLGAKDIFPNSERILNETRDRLHSDRIVDSVSLSRHVDYEIDYLAGSHRLREPVPSRPSH